MPPLVQVSMLAAMQAKSRRLCQDQLAWFRDDPLFYWVDASQPAASLTESILQSINADFHQGMSFAYQGFSAPSNGTFESTIFHLSGCITALYALFKAREKHARILRSCLKGTI